MKLSDLQKLTHAFNETMKASVNADKTNVNMNVNMNIGASGNANISANEQKMMYELLNQIGIDTNTFYQELEMTSRYVDTHRDVSYSNAQIQLHSHSFYELIYCRNTCGAEYLIGSERYRLMRGDLVFVPPGVSHRPLLPENISEPYKRYVLWMSQEFVENYAKLSSDFSTNKQQHARMFRTRGTPWNERLAELFRLGVMEEEEKKEGWEAAVIGNTINLLTQIKRATKESNSNTFEAEKPELLDKIMAFVESNFKEEIVINDVAKTFYVSESTISHLFKQKMGISFYRFVTQRRLIAAKELIESDLALEDVATQVGFSEYSGFYRAFKKEYGISPRQYRNLQDKS